MAHPLLEIDGFTFRYRRATEPAVVDLRLRLEPGETLLVAGPSGCGKSTLVRAINGLIPHAYRGQSSGSVRIAGQSTEELRLREIGLVVATLLQDPAKQILGATVEAELAFGPENLGWAPADIRRQIGTVLDRAGIAGLAGRETAHLSGGEAQLLAMAGSMMMDPRIFVVDEPLANLDPASANRLLVLLRALADGGQAVAIVEHRVEEALALRPDRILYLEGGRVTYLGPPGGFLAVARPDAVKLPFAAVLDHERRLPTAAPEPLPIAGEGGGASRLAFDGLHVTLGERRVIRGLSVDLGARDVVAVLGPNGSGKTTLFRTAMRLLDPAAGHVRVDGVDARRRTVADLAHTFGYVFQSPSQMLFARTVRDELLFGPRNLGLAIPDPESHALAALYRVGLADEDNILERPPMTLSFGQQKRLALAIALAMGPPALLLDEPSAGQDYRSAAAFMGELARIPGLETLYFVTHDVDLALVHATRILLLRNGTVVADGAPREVIADTEAWRASNLHRTSLMDANQAWRHRTDRFLDARSLARRIVAEEHVSGLAGAGGSPA